MVPMLNDEVSTERLESSRRLSGCSAVDETGGKPVTDADSEFKKDVNGSKLETGREDDALESMILEVVEKVLDDVVGAVTVDWLERSRRLSA